MIEKTQFGDPFGGFGPEALDPCAENCHAMRGCTNLACALNWGNDQQNLAWVRENVRFHQLTY